MADEPIAAAAEDGGPPRWRALWASAAALAATLALIGLIFAITWSNRARDEALGWERRSHQVMLLTRSIDAAIARAEAALGRYVLDEEQTTGTDYYNAWRSAGWHIGQLRRLLGLPRSALGFERCILFADLGFARRVAREVVLDRLQPVVAETVSRRAIGRGGSWESGTICGPPSAGRWARARSPGSWAAIDLLAPERPTSRRASSPSWRPPRSGRRCCGCPDSARCGPVPVGRGRPYEPCGR